MRIIISTVAALLMSTLAAFAADPVGSYTVKGTNPGNNGTYSGRVTERDCEWRIGGAWHSRGP